MYVAQQQTKVLLLLPKLLKNTHFVYLSFFGLGHSTNFSTRYFQKLVSLQTYHVQLTQELQSTLAMVTLIFDEKICGTVIILEEMITIVRRDIVI